MKKRFFILDVILIISLVLTSTGNSFAIKTSDQSLEGKPDILAKSAVLMDAKSGEILYEKNMNSSKEPASLTKIMTALLVVENLQLDKMVTVDEEVTWAEGSSIHLKTGEQISVRELLYALLLKSANDAAVALAKAVSGDTENFVIMMNKKASELGLKSTRFKNPNGLHVSDHYTSAHDITIIAREAMKNDIIRSYVSTVFHIIPKTNMSEARNLENINHLLCMTDETVEVNGCKRPVFYEGAIGVKTGYTNEAKHCMVSMATRGEKEFLVTVMSSDKDGKYSDSIKLLDYAFSNFSPVEIIREDEGEFLKIKDGKKKSVKAIVKEDVFVTLPKGARRDKLNCKIKATKKLEAPIEQGDIIGRLEIYYGETLIKKLPAYAQENCEKGGLMGFFRSVFILQVLIILASAALIVTLAKLYNIRRRIEARREEEKKRKQLEIEMVRVKRNMEKFSKL